LARYRADFDKLTNRRTDEIGMTAPSAVITRAAAISKAAADAASWIEANGGRLRQDKATLAREFRRDGRRGAQLQEAAKNPMCVAVFGASQAGKSYLVSRLAAPPGGQLAVRFGTETLDFLGDINPPGGQEATGLVTRFTMRPMPAPAEAPVTLRLLSQIDVVKILANTFLEDFDTEIAPPDTNTLDRRLAALAEIARPAPVDTLTQDDVEDLAEYFHRHFHNNPLLQHLESVGYWPRAVELAPRLGIAERATLFAVLWGDTTRFTDLYAQLVGELAKLQFVGVVHCGLDALVPRERSLIDVRRLFSIGKPQDPSETLRVTLASGAQIMIGRALLAALVAEMTVPLADRPWPFFDAADLLDFPGARSREAIVDAERFLAQPEKLGFALLRGKVAYLFQRYNAEQEITAMLLCVGPSNQDVQTLPRMVKEWVDQTLGATPQARAQQRTSLFFVLTKFDAEFEEKAGEHPASEARWTTRLQASLTDFFKSYDWPEEWTPGKPFDNLFWLRNPSIRFGAVFDYGVATAPGDTPPELGVAPRAAAAVAQKRAAYLANVLVRKHIADPTGAWDAALTPNDGGIGRLAAGLGPVCDPTLKAGQISGRVEELARAMTERLRPLWRSDDLTTELAQAKVRAAGVVRALLDCAQAQMFGRLLRSLQITPEQVAGVHWRMQTQPDDAATPVGTVAATDDYAADLAELLGNAVPTLHGGRQDYFERFAGLVVAAWDETLSAFASNIGARATYRLPPDQAALLVGQIAAAARRRDLRGSIAATLRERASFVGRAAAGSGKFVLVAEDLVNGFVSYLGFDQMAEARRPAAGRSQRRIFAARPLVRGLPPLTPQPSNYDYDFQVDWMFAFARTMEDNVSDRTDEGFDHAANDALGLLVARLTAGAPAGPQS
jgi:hypothetical protein